MKWLSWATPAGLAAFGAILAAIGAFWASNQSSRHQRDLRARADEIAGLNRELVKKNEELLGSTRNALDWVTGGASFVYLEPLRKVGKVRYFVRQSGQHPTYDVVVRVQEVHLLAERKKSRVLLFGPAEVGRTLRRGSGFDWTYPDPSPSDPREWPLVFFEPPAPDAKARTFRVELASRNGIIVQVLRVWPVGDRWHTDSKRIKGPAAKLRDDYQEAQQQPDNPADVVPEDDLE